MLLSQMIKSNYIQLDGTAKDFEEAIVLAMKPLLEDGVITKSYVDKILEIYHETGPYIVITKQVALPHAPAEAGAKKLAMGITRLTDPVKSGHETNDPVKYLFALSAPDGNAHLQALSEFVELLSNEAFYELLEKATKEEIIDYLKTYEGIEENG